jgi:hypothetical protein
MLSQMSLHFHRRSLWLLALILVLGAAALADSFQQLSAARKQYATQAALAGESARQIHDNTVIYSELDIGPGVTFSDALQRMQVQPDEAAVVIGSVDGVFDLRQFRAGAELEVGRSIEGQLREVRYRIDADRMLAIRRATGAQVQPGSGEDSF